MFKQLDIHKTPDEIQRLFDEMNPNGDGQVGFEEFAETIQRQIANGGSVAHLFKEASQFYNFINPGFGTDPNAEEAAASSPSAPVVYVWKRCFLFIPIVLVWPLMIMLVWWDLPGSYHSLLLTEPIQEGRPLQKWEEKVLRKQVHNMSVELTKRYVPDLTGWIGDRYSDELVLPAAPGVETSAHRRPDCVTELTS